MNYKVLEIGGFQLGLRYMNQKNENIYIVIPAYNEGTVIKKVVEDVKRHGFDNVLVVDDGSSDETGKAAAEASAIVITHHLNRGKGAATMTGIEAARSHKAEIVVTMDGDGQHDPNDIEQLIKPIVVKQAEVALGTRLLNLKTAPWHKIAHNHAANMVTWMIARRWINDSQSGFRAYHHSVFDRISVKADKYEFDSEMIRAIIAAKVSFVEVPIRVRYTKYSTTKVHKQSIINGIKTLYKLIWNTWS